MLIKLAFRNIVGVGLRTWLNVLILSFSYVVIIWSQGFYTGMNEFAMNAMINSDIGGGQFWVSNYDPYDILSLDDAHAEINEELEKMISAKRACSILITSGTIYPNGQLKSILVKGINEDQNTIDIPTKLLKSKSEITPAIIGSRMSQSTGLKKGDEVVLRWRDKDGAFDAMEISIVEIMKTSVQNIDVNQVWLSLSDLQKMTGLENEATIITLSKNEITEIKSERWIFKSKEDLLKDLKAIINSKKAGSSIMYILLLFLAMLAIFDTQILSIFKRKKEIGTLMALGMTRRKVVGLFTIEGILHGVLAAFVGAIYGIPLLIFSANKGFELPESYDGYGLVLGEKLLPVYSFALIVGTAILVMSITIIVSYIPIRKISKLKPTDALRGK